MRFLKCNEQEKGKCHRPKFPAVFTLNVSRFKISPFSNVFILSLIFFSYYRRGWLEANHTISKRRTKVLTLKVEYFFWLLWLSLFFYFFYFLFSPLFSCFWAWKYSPKTFNKGIENMSNIPSSIGNEIFFYGQPLFLILYPPIFIWLFLNGQCKKRMRWIRKNLLTHRKLWIVTFLLFVEKWWNNVFYSFSWDFWLERTKMPIEWND